MALKKEKQKKSQTNVEKYNFFSLEEMKAREIKYMNRVMELKKCINFVEDAVLEIGYLNNEQSLRDNWNEFLSCNPLPKPYIPPDIRLFYSKLKFMQNENVDKNINWLLSVNERSVLSQDLFGEDVTLRKLKTKLKKNIGHEYNGYIKDSINVLRRIENFLDNDVEILKYSVRVLDDIVKRKLAVQQEIMEFLDRFTYRIISSENAEMMSIDAITAEYFFIASEFVIHIWCLKNVAVRFSYLSEPRLLADFSSIKLSLHIPAEMLKENLVVRAIHMKFDHLSENAKSFKSQFLTSTKVSSDTNINLHKCLLNEWSIQIDLQNKKISEMNKIYLEYQALKQQYDEQIEKLKHKSKDEQKPKKPMKLPKQPFCVGDNMVPDIYEEFLQQEQTQFENFMNNTFRPELYDLSTDEINLRKYNILGGIYQLYYIQKPLHIDFNSFNMTWHKNDTKLVIEKNTVIENVAYDFSRRTTKRFTKRMSVVDLKRRLTQPDIDSPWFILTVELPEYLCHWGEPIACHFEETIKDQQYEGSEVTHDSKASSLIIQPSSQQNLEEPNNIFSLISKSSLTKAPLKEDTNSLTSSTTSLKSMPINDFSLLEILTKPQIRHIEKHILPRIISSFKFPKEIIQEDSEFLENKPKGKGGRIVRRKVEELPQLISQQYFTYNDRQNHPERMYTKYTRVENIRIVSLLNKLISIEDQKQPETFAQLLQIVKDIKEKYKSNKNNILELKPLKQKIITQNKKIKQMLKEKKRNSEKIVNKTTLQSINFSAYESVDIETPLKIIEAENPIEEESQPEIVDNVLNEPDELAILDDDQIVTKSESVKYMHWTTKHVIKSHFDRNNRKMIIHTDRLGNFGFAFKRYEHFPFKNWSLEPHADDPDNEVVFTLETQYVRCVLRITANGILGHVTEPTKTFVRNPKIYLNIENPIKDFKKLKHVFKEKYLNIFAEEDASFYIENGYFSEKHLPNELHTYNCMAVHSTQMSFNFSHWNRLATRRDIVLKFVKYKDTKENLVEVRITPGKAFFVEVQELCSDDLDAIKLDYNLTWRNIEAYSDLHHLIVSMYPAATELRCKNPKLLCFIKDLLSEIRPLSFS